MLSMLLFVHFAALSPAPRPVPAPMRDSLVIMRLPPAISRRVPLYKPWTLGPSVALNSALTNLKAHGFFDLSQDAIRAACGNITLQARVAVRVMHDSTSIELIVPDKCPAAASDVRRQLDQIREDARVAEEAARRRR